MQVEQIEVLRKILNSEDCVHQLCTFIFTPNSTDNAGTYRVVITASGDNLNLTQSFTFPCYLGMLKIDIMNDLSYHSYCLMNKQYNA